MEIDFGVVVDALPGLIWSTRADGRTKVCEQLTRLMTTGEMFDATLRMRHKDGSYRWLRCRCVPCRDAQGHIARYVTVQSDVHDLKRAQDLLAAEVELLDRVARGDALHQVLEALGLGIEELCGGYHCCVLRIACDRAQLQVAAGSSRPRACSQLFEGITIDPAVADAALQARERELREAYAQLSEGQRLSKTGSFTSDIQRDEHRWSDEFYRIFEIDPGTPPSLEAVRARIHPDDLPLYDAEIRRGLEGSGADFDFRVITPRAGLKYLRGVAQVMEYIDNRPIFMGVVQDVSARRRAEDGLNRARSELAHVARVATLNAMTASIAHEVSQPLSGILTNANTGVRMLAADPPNLAGLAETVKRTLRDAHRATEVIKRLRALFSNKSSTLERVDLNDVAREVIALSASELQRHRALLQTDFAAGLPRVRGDRVQLQQVILNLLLNAAESMADVVDRPRTLLITTGPDDDGSVRLSVRDSGTGLNPDATEKPFEAFYTTKAQGLGIGLSISRSIIERHDGQLWVEANDGPGATFSFRIPSLRELSGANQPLAA